MLKCIQDWTGSNSDSILIEALVRKGLINIIRLKPYYSQLTGRVMTSQLLYLLCGLRFASNFWMGSDKLLVLLSASSHFASCLHLLIRNILTHIPGNWCIRPGYCCHATKTSVPFLVKEKDADVWGRYIPFWFHFLLLANDSETWIV